MNIFQLGWLLTSISVSILILGIYLAKKKGMTNICAVLTLVIGIFSSVLSPITCFAIVASSPNYEVKTKIPHNQITIVKTKDCVHVDFRLNDTIMPVTYKRLSEYNIINDSTIFYLTKGYNSYNKLMYTKISYQNIKK